MEPVSVLVDNNVDFASASYVKFVAVRNTVHIFNIATRHIRVATTALEEISGTNDDFRGSGDIIINKTPNGGKTIEISWGSSDCRRQFGRVKPEKEEDQDAIVSAIRSKIEEETKAE